ncbi:MAG: carbon-nitrogen hydrolase family protein [Gemmatimonadota bacterium]|nr:carbon-nitrogen hydrolase family protein [Gemmatimonadota bacterium]
MRVTICQLDNRPERLPAVLEALAEHASSADSSFLLLPEMPFSPWLAGSKDVDATAWRKGVAEHERQIGRLERFDVPAIVATRPIVRTDGSFGNEAFAWSPAEGAAGVHEKYYLPDESGYWEATWYGPGLKRFDAFDLGSARVGVQICTEMWFFEWARAYARQGVELLCVPRATPHETSEKWLAGGRTAAVCAGAYCLSSNLWTPPGLDVDCGGTGFVVDPDGEVLATTSEDEPFVTIDVDLGRARASKATYPRYVAE